MLSKKHVLITGCNGGIGIGILRLLIKNNAKISISYNKNRSQIDNFLAENKEYTKNIQVYQADLTNDDELNTMLNSVVSLNNLSSSLLIEGIMLFITILPIPFLPTI